MPSVVGLGAIVIYTDAPEALAGWYRAQLGIDTAFHAADRSWTACLRDPATGRSVPFGILPTPAPLEPGPRAVMIKYKVDDMNSFLARFRARGIRVDEIIESADGRFASMADPDGNPIELWQPAAAR
jgi:glyoxylase I family protein